MGLAPLSDQRKTLKKKKKRKLNPQRAGPAARRQFLKFLLSKKSLQFVKNFQFRKVRVASCNIFFEITN